MASQAYNGRTLSIYFSSPEEMKKYHYLAELQGVATSKFILSLAEEALAAREKPASHLAEDHQTLLEENARLREDLKLKALLIEKQTKEINQLRAEMILGDQDGLTDESTLIAVLKAGPMHDKRLARILGMETPDDLLALSKELEELEDRGLITKTGRGWQWIG